MTNRGVSRCSFLVRAIAVGGSFLGFKRALADDPDDPPTHLTDCVAQTPEAVSESADDVSPHPKFATFSEIPFMQSSPRVFEMVTLVPYGCTRLQLTIFPQASGLTPI